MATLAAYARAVGIRTLDCMQISEQRIQEFRRLWKEEFGEELPIDVARHEAALLLELYLALAEPLSSERQPSPSAKDSLNDS